MLAFVRYCSGLSRIADKWSGLAKLLVTEIAYPVRCFVWMQDASFGCGAALLNLGFNQCSR